VNQIKKIRQEKGVSLYWLSKKTGIAYKNLWLIEHGTDLRVSTLKRIANALKCNASELIE
jgi:DNA-binding Xre family transcriptional regulator